MGDLDSRDKLHVSETFRKEILERGGGEQGFPTGPGGHTLRDNALISELAMAIAVQVAIDLIFGWWVCNDKFISKKMN